MDTMDEDGVDFTPTGRIRFIIDGLVYTLRRPKLGEFRQYRERLTAMRDTIQARQKTDEPIDDIGMVAEWLRVVFNGAPADDSYKPIHPLSDRPLPEDSDEWPTWMVGGDLATQMVQHWTAVPLAPGGPRR